MRGLVHSTRALVILNSVLAPPLALAQPGPETAPTPPATADRPRFFVWGLDGVPCGIHPDRVNGFQTGVVKLNLSANEQPAVALDRMAQYIFKHNRAASGVAWNTTLNYGVQDGSPGHPRCQEASVTLAPDLSPTDEHPEWVNTVCISVQNFGHDSVAVDVPDPSHPAQDWSSSQLRFFTEADRLPDYIHGNYLNVTDETYGFPIRPSDTPIPSDRRLWPAWYSSRSFRHPFLWNAGMYVKLDGTGTRGTAPLRAWMTTFLQTYIDYQNGGDFPNLPDPSRLYFDTEPYVTDAGSMFTAWQNVPNGFDNSANCVYILQQIYDSRRPAHRPAPDGHSYPNLWDGEIKVPGDPDGFNLHDAYLRDQPLFDLPVLNGEPSFADFSSTVPGTTPAVPRTGAHASNRKIMTWWSQVCQRAADAVMYHSMYEVAHAKFSAAKVGNYSTSQNDGALRASGLFQDQSTTCVGDTTCVYQDLSNRLSTHEPLASTVTVVDSSPSCIRATDLEGGGFWHVDTGLNAGKWRSERRWGSVVQTSFGNVDSPVNYPLANDIGTWGRQRQRNLYGKKIGGTGPNILEFRHESALRLHRLNLEASVAGFYAGQSRKLVPWINTVHPESGPPYSAFELAQELALVRSKRIEEALVFQTHTFNTQASIDAWNLNEMAIRDVYSPVVKQLSYLAPPSAVISTTDPNVLTRVGSTLTTAPSGRVTFDVTNYLFSGIRGMNLMVDFKDAFPDYEEQPRLTRLVNDTVHHRDFLLNLECRAVRLDGSPKPSVYITASCRRENNAMFQLATFDGESLITNGRNSAGEVRCMWLIPNSPLDPSTARIDPSHIQIAAESRDGEDFRIEFDLIQIIPYITSGDRIAGFESTPTGLTAPGPGTATVSGNVFRDTGLLVVWTSPIKAEFRGDETPHYLRMYYSTGDPDSPLANMTCMTEQTLVTFTGESDPRAVRIKYRPQGRVADLPGGDYQFATFDRGGTSLHSVCRDASYPKLREAMNGPIELDPILPAEYFSIHVPITNVSGLPTSEEGCHHGTCISDVDDGSMTNTPDGGVTIDDLLYYLILFEVGTDCADVDDGSDTGTLDGGVTIDDLLYYLERFEIGC